MDLSKMTNRVIGPVVTLLVLAMIYYLPALHGTVALAFVPLVWSAYTGGLIPALISAALITGFATVDYLPDYNRIGQVAASVLMIAIMVGYLKRYAELSQSLNGNLRRLREAIELVRRLKNEWPDLSDSGRYKLVDSIEDRLGNLAALVFGWHSIRLEQEHIKQELGIKELDPDED